MNASKHLRPYAELAAQYQVVRVSTLCWLAEHKVNTKGLAPISLRITVAGKRIERSTGIRVAVPVRDEQGNITTPGGWDVERECIQGKSRLVTTQNEQLELLKAHVRDLVNLMKANGRRVSAHTLRKQMLAPAVGKPVCFIELCQQQVAGFYEGGNQSTLTQKRGAIAVLTAWNGLTKAGAARPLLLEDFGVDRAAQFYNWLLGVRGLAVGSANVVIGSLRTLFGCAVKMGDAEEALNPFRLLKLKRVPASVRTQLTADQLAALREAALPTGPALARDIYLTQYYLHGSRAGVVLMLRWQDIEAGCVHFKAEKNGPHKCVPIAAELERVLTRYRPAGKPTGLIFPLLPADFYELGSEAQYKARHSALSAANRNLRLAAAAVGIAGRIHTHTARHTLALHAAELGGLPLAQAMLGHTDQKQTERYVGPMQQDKLAAAERLLYGAPVPNATPVIPMWKGGTAA